MVHRLAGASHAARNAVLFSAVTCRNVLAPHLLVDYSSLCQCVHRSAGMVGVWSSPAQQVRPNTTGRTHWQPPPVPKLTTHRCSREQQLVWQAEVSDEWGSVQQRPCSTGSNSVICRAIVIIMCSMNCSCRPQPPPWKSTMQCTPLVAKYGIPSSPAAGCLPLSGVSNH